jgi:alanyl-tRNA synthetase
MTIDKSRMYVTVFEGDSQEKLEKDQESYAFWKEWIDESRILPGSKKDNFWEMGDSGPCGPCSEIHVDIRPDKERKLVDGRTLVNRGNPFVIEIWNLVFMQYNRRATGELELLRQNHVDTGLGFERLCMVLQGKTSNYDTDIFQPVIQEIAALTGVNYGGSEKTDIAMRVMADHLRAIAFAIADGQLPSNTKAGYVIRRILRRAVRYNYTFLGQNRPMLFKLLPALMGSMGSAFPELKVQRSLIERVIFEEEQGFLRTLENGDKRLSEASEILKSKGDTVLNGRVAFELYDTYGFPRDLTELILKEKGLSMNASEFDAEMAAQKSRSKSAALVESADWIVLRDDNTEADFVGYDHLLTEIRICRFRKVTIKGKSYFHLVFDRTPFYAESGGQVGDSGFVDDGEQKIRIINTLREHGLVIHITDQLPADPSATLEASVDTLIRQKTAANHTATHLLHHALRHTLGNHVEQRGSLVTSESLRFDFLHFQRMTEEELQRVENLVNAWIREGLQRDEIRDTSIEEARNMGAVALFGEKYGERVRVIRFGESIELCGGTHVENTSRIGIFKIVSEGSIAAGIRRIEAVTGELAEDWYHQLEKSMKEAYQLLNHPQDILKAISVLLSEKVTLQKQVDHFIQEQVGVLKRSVLNNTAVSIGGVRLIQYMADGLSADAGVIKDALLQIRKDHPDMAVVVGATIGGKPHLAVMIPDILIQSGNKNAGEIIKLAAREMDGGGGGQPGYATAGGKAPDRLPQAITKAVELISTGIDLS